MQGGRKASRRQAPTESIVRRSAWPGAARLGAAWLGAAWIGAAWIGAVWLGTACSPSADAPGTEGLVEHRAAFETLCFAETRSEAISVFPFAPKMTQLNAWLDTELTDPMVRKFHREELPLVRLADQGERLRSQAKAAGVPICPLGGLIDYLGGLSAVAGDVEGCARACMARHVGVEGPAVDDACRTGCGG